MSKRVSMMVCASKQVVNAGLHNIPRDVITAYYRAWDIDLTFVDGPVLKDDPTNDPAAIDKLCNEHRPPTGHSGPALFIMAEMSAEGSNVNGILLDAASRGCAAVFTESDVYQDNVGDARFEVIVHEIGHLLNLVHQEANETFATAMSQWDDRALVDDRTALWQQLIQNSVANRRLPISAYFGSGTRVPLGLPMSRSCQGWLTDAETRFVEPWGDPFRDVAGEDRAGRLDLDRPASCKLSVPDPRIGLGEPVNLRITLAADGASSAPVIIPTGFGIREGTIALTIENSSGMVKNYRPKMMICSSGTRIILPETRIHRSYSLLSDRNGLLFREPGSYTLQASVPSMGLISNKVVVDVENPRSVFADAGFAQFMHRGMPRSDTDNWRLVAQAVNDKSLKPTVRAFLANERVLKKIARIDAANAGLIERVEYSALRTYQKNLQVRLARLYNKGSTADPAASSMFERAEQALRDDDIQHPGLSYLNSLRKKAERRR